ncbi:hypothetical protein BGAPBR_E0037 (plasmid) [Borreliella garinii PBr]|uniref:Uncharacterized protein n=1 Tax=Borreliella garinii PBr TaxID=498743 RepID=B8F0L7_BORGR|nr:hypothetical protein BGAPBR_E0037 [Borreliella garinii PBr]
MIVINLLGSNILYIKDFDFFIIILKTHSFNLYFCHTRSSIVIFL